MTELSFDIETPSDVPVQVYDSELHLVDAALSSGHVTVGPGTYFVLAHMPDGSQIRQSVQIADQASASVPLTRQRAKPPPPVAANQFPAKESWADDPWPRSHSGHLPGQATAPSIPPHVVMRGYVRDDDGRWRETARISVIEFIGPLLIENELDAVALERPDGRLTVVRIPGHQVQYLEFALERARDGGGLQLAARLAHAAADSLLAYLNHDQLTDAKLMVQSPALAAERLLYEKTQNPLAAAAGAFALLRLDALDRLHDWTKNLAEWFPWLPDGLVVRAEHLARLGQHEAAAELLRQLPQRGVPALSVGLDYAVDRLRTYSAFWPDDDRLRRTLESLTRYALATDFAAPVTTFTALAPDVPEPRVEASTPT